MLALIASAWALPVQADIFMYRDTRGGLHFSNAPTEPHYMPRPDTSSRECCTCLSKHEYHGTPCMEDMTASKCTKVLEEGGSIIYVQGCHNKCAHECRSLRSAE